MGRALRFAYWVLRYGRAIARRLEQLLDLLDQAKIAFEVIEEAVKLAKTLGQEQRYTRLLIDLADTEADIKNIKRNIERVKRGLDELP